MTRLRTQLFAALALAAVGLMASHAHAQVIRLASKAVVEAGQDVRLGNIATITGADQQTAEKLANTVIANASSNPVTIKAESVVMAIVAQQGTGALSTTFQLSGAASCDVRINSLPASANAALSVNAPAAMPVNVFATTTTFAPTASPSENAPVLTAGVMPAADTSSTVEINSLSQLINERVQRELQLNKEQLTISLNSTNPIVDQPTPAGMKWNIRPASRTLIGGVPIQADLIQGSRVVQSLRFDAFIQRLQEVVVAKVAIARGDIMTPDKFTTQIAQLDRNMPTLFTNKKDVIGLEAQRDVMAGTQLDTRDFKPVEMAARGDAVNVIYVAGNLQVRVTGRAGEPGKMHDAIKITNESNGQSYTATLIGRRLAVVGATLTDEQEAKLRETH